jgi:hypothetical protein
VLLMLVAVSGRGSWRLKVRVGGGAWLMLVWAQLKVRVEKGLG